MTRALVVGAGSIGIRHAAVLSELGVEVALVTARSDLARPTFTTIEEGLREFDPVYVVVSTATADHARAVEELRDAGYRGRLMVEKPLAIAPQELAGFSRVGVGFNLRFHPVIARLNEVLAGKPVHTLEVYVGQHLSQWRPERPVHEQYSASRARGGGVLRDLAHEWDYLSVIFGPVRGLFAQGGRLSDITVDSDDAWAIIAEFERAPVASVQFNYLDTQARRRIVTNFSGGTIEADLVASTVRINDDLERLPTERNETYRAMHDAMLRSGDGVASADDASGTDRLIAMVEASAASRQWVEAP